jgi:hypothetical protein
MNRRLIISLLCAGALAFACMPRSRSDTPMSLGTASASQSATKAPAPRKAAAKNEPRLDSRLNVTVANHDVRLALAIKNVGGKYAEITFPSGQSYDFVVVDTAGNEVWRWSKRRMFTSGVQNKQLGAGEGMQISEEWSTAEPGRYTAIATLRSSNFPVEQRVDFVMQ